MRMVVALDGKPVAVRVDLYKATPARFQVFAESNSDRPQQFVGVGCEANPFAEIEQKQRVCFRLLAPSHVSDRDVYAQQLASVVVHWVITAQPVARFFSKNGMGALNLFVNDRLTRFNDAAVMSFDGIGELRHRLANGLADEIV